MNRFVEHLNPRQNSHFEQTLIETEYDRNALKSSMV